MTVTNSSQQVPVAEATAYASSFGSLETVTGLGDSKGRTLVVTHQKHFERGQKVRAGILGAKSAVVSGCSSVKAGALALRGLAGSAATRIGKGATQLAGQVTTLTVSLSEKAEKPLTPPKFARRKEMVVAFTRDTDSTQPSPTEQPAPSRPNFKTLMNKAATEFNPLPGFNADIRAIFKGAETFQTKANEAVKGGYDAINAFADGVRTPEAAEEGQELVEPKSLINSDVRPISSMLIKGATGLGVAVATVASGVFRFIVKPLAGIALAVTGVAIGTVIGAGALVVKGAIALKNLTVKGVKVLVGSAKSCVTHAKDELKLAKINREKAALFAKDLKAMEKDLQSLKAQKEAAMAAANQPEKLLRVQLAKERCERSFDKGGEPPCSAKEFVGEGMLKVMALDRDIAMMEMHIEMFKNNETQDVLKIDSDHEPALFVKWAQSPKGHAIIADENPDGVDFQTARLRDGFRTSLGFTIHETDHYKAPADLVERVEAQRNARTELGNKMRKPFEKAEKAFNERVAAPVKAKVSAAAEAVKEKAVKARGKVARALSPTHMKRRAAQKAEMKGMVAMKDLAPSGTSTAE
ncbi:MAG: hypothetical protein S4CHLAM102_01450 [Chlamydiia bacterium]|nr:hypothetical protein [Chlamydiia bacterium]